MGKGDKGTNVSKRLRWDIRGKREAMEKTFIGGLTPLSHQAREVTRVRCHGAPREYADVCLVLHVGTF